MHNLSDRTLKKIIKTRDPRYDGYFYFGVKTTKIYCRPICPARPKPENIIIFKSQTAAELEGYRPCKRCRPDSILNGRFLDEKASIVEKALELIELSEDFLNVEIIADRLNISSRHLRRLFKSYLGASPLDILNTRRLHLSKSFLLNTNKSITNIAFAVGFSSIRRFNEAFKALYQENPSEMRKSKGQKINKKNWVIIEQPIRKPYDWDYVLEYLDRHLIFGMEKVHENVYTRFIEDDEEIIGKVEVRYNDDRGLLQFKFVHLSLKTIKGLIPKLRNLFDINHNPNYLPSKNKKTLSIRVPTSFNSFEVAVSIILGQLISTGQAKQKLADLITKYGIRKKSILFPEEIIIAFPTPETLSRAKKIESIGITKIKAHAIKELAKIFSSGDIKIDHSASFECIKEKLLNIKGIGPWTANLISMRCFGNINSFPRSDLFIKRAIDRKLIDPLKWDGHKAYLCHLVWRDLGARLKK